ncbi:MAG TPA: dicarboxylate/amino acid:cation symporter, partial [Oceanicaulis sp.]|nr:dicarboxylate/amino acid:cation symporter [Oceanicaulis sp.]
MKWWFGTALWKRVLGALVLGIGFGALMSQIMGADAATYLIESYVRPVGDL